MALSLGNVKPVTFPDLNAAGAVHANHCTSKAGVRFVRLDGTKATAVPAMTTPAVRFLSEAADKT
jgi:hypothetical protein